MLESQGENVFILHHFIAHILQQKTLRKRITEEEKRRFQCQKSHSASQQDLNFTGLTLNVTALYVVKSVLQRTPNMLTDGTESFSVRPLLDLVNNHSKMFG